MEKRYILVMLPIVLLFALFPIAANADIIPEPSDNFYERNRADCEYINRVFYANGESGYIMLKNEPGSRDEVIAFVNGTIVNVSFTYDRNGEQWGVITYETAAGQGDEWNTNTGWIPMSELVVVYDYISFNEDHAGEIYDYSGGSPDSLSENLEIVIWAWPGSGEVLRTLTTSSGRDFTEGELTWLTPEKAYTDADGREWGFIPYFYSSRNTWLCLSDPTNADIPAFNPAPTPQLRTPIDPGALPSPRSGFPMLPIIISLVAIVVIGSAILIKIFWKPNKANDQKM